MVLVVIRLLASEKAVLPLPLTSTYQDPGTRNGGAMIMLPEANAVVSQVLSGANSGAREPKGTVGLRQIQYPTQDRRAIKVGWHYHLEERALGIGQSAGTTLV